MASISSFDVLLGAFEIKDGRDFVQLRKRHLFNWILLLAAAGYSVLLFTTPGNELFGRAVDGQTLSLLLSFLAVLLGSVVAYVLSRITSVEWGAIFFFTLVLHSTALGERPHNVASGLALVNLVWPIMAASIIVRPWAGFVFATMASLLIVNLGIVVPGGAIFIRNTVFFYTVACIFWLFVTYQEHGLRALDAINSRLGESERRFRMLFADNPIPMMVYDVETLHFLEINDMTLATYGYSREEFQAMRITDIRPPEDVPVLLKHLGEPREPVRQSGHWRHVLKDGRIIDVDITSHVIAFQGRRAALVVAQDITGQKQAERQLQEQNAILNGIIESTDSPIFSLDTEFNYTSFNRAHAVTMQSLYGVDIELGGNRPDYITVAADRDRTRTYLERALQGSSFTVEFAAGDEALSRRHFELTYNPIRGSQDAIIGISIFANDITERRQMEEENRKLLAELRLFYEMPFVGMALLTPDKRWIRANPYMCIKLGYTWADLCQMTWDDVTHPDDRALGQGELETLLRGEIDDYQIEKRLARSDGEIVYAQIDVRCVRFPAGKVDYLVMIIRDVTQQRRAEEQLRLFQRAVEQSPASIVITDPNGSIEYVNAKFSQVTGYAASEVLGQNPRILKSGFTSLEEYRTMWKTITSGQIWRGEFRNRRKDGELFWESAIISPMRSSRGVITNFLAVKEDITERKAYEEQLRKLNEELEARVKDRTAELTFTNAQLEHAARTRDEFLATMSHELRTPLHSIMISCELLESAVHGELGERQLRSVHIISESSTHLLDLINDVLDVSKMEVGRLTLNVENVSVDEICTASLRFVKQQAAKQQLELDYSISDPALMMTADPQRLKQILVNLLSNAVKFTPAGGHVSLGVAADSENKRVRFTVSDTGVGIKPSDMPKLFQPFTQLDSGLNRAHAGTGLGLTLVHQLADLHGGSVAVMSTVGEGSTFTVTLPWSPAPDSYASGPSSAMAPATGVAGPRVRSNGHPWHILLVDDNETSSAVLATALEAAGLQVTLANRGDMAVHSAEELEPDLILMDIQMPHVDGLDAIRQIRALPKTKVASLPIIALTALALPGDRERCLAAGANDYLSKPVSVQMLAETIDRHLVRATTRKRRFHDESPGHRQLRS